MPILHASPRHPFSWSFDVAVDGEPVTTLELAWFRSAAAFEHEGRRLELVRAPGFGEFQLVSHTGVVATAVKPSLFARRYTIEYGRRRFTLEAAGPFSRRFVLVEDDKEVGEVAPEGPIARRCRLRAPDDLPVTVQVFLLWLVVLQWRHSAQH